MLATLASATLAIDVSVFRPSASTWARTQCGGRSGSTDMPSRWASQVTPSKPPLPQYPRPNLLRSVDGSFDRDKGDPSTWSTLNGLWEWQPATSATAPPPFGNTLSGSILVPYPIESCLSSVAPASSSAFVERSFYRLVVVPPTTTPGRRLLLRFGAINWQAAVYIDGALAANHTGGYDAFDVELTSNVGRNATLEILVAVYNPADRGAQPNGKARIGAISSPGGDTYTPASGIWQVRPPTDPGTLCQCARSDRPWFDGWSPSRCGSSRCPRPSSRGCKLARTTRRASPSPPTSTRPTSPPPSSSAWKIHRRHVSSLRAAPRRAVLSPSPSPPQSYGRRPRHSSTTSACAVPRAETRSCLISACARSRLGPTRLAEHPATAAATTLTSRPCSSAPTL
jgi:hypothetical protein